MNSYQIILASKPYASQYGDVECCRKEWFNEKESYKYNSLHNWCDILGVLFAQCWILGEKPYGRIFVLCYNSMDGSCNSCRGFCCIEFDKKTKIKNVFTTFLFFNWFDNLFCCNKHTLLHRWLIFLVLNWCELATKISCI